MPVIDVDGAAAIVKVVVPLDAWAGLLTRHRVDNKETLTIENLARDLIAGDFPPGSVTAFVKAVCYWGGYSGIGGRILKNPEQVLAAALRDAHGYLALQDPPKALHRLRQVKDFGVSFGSKHLRFLAPDQAVVLDSVIATRLGYSMDAEGYAAFLQDCRVMLAIVRARIPFPLDEPRSWRISDVEAALYQRLQESKGLPSPAVAD